MPDNYSQWERHDRKNEEAVARLPRCSECGHHIQDERAYYINGEWICESCMEDYHVNVDDYYDL